MKNGAGGRTAAETARSSIYPPMNAGPAPPDAGATSVQFVVDERGRRALFVDTADRGTLLLVIVRSLYKIGVQIAGSQITMRDDRARHWFYLVERDGSPMRSARRSQVERSVTVAIATMECVEGWAAV